MFIASDKHYNAQQKKLATASFFLSYFISLYDYKFFSQIIFCTVHFYNCLLGSFDFGSVLDQYPNYRPSGEIVS